MQNPGQTSHWAEPLSAKLHKEESRNELTNNVKGYEIPYDQRDEFTAAWVRHGGKEEGGKERKFSRDRRAYITINHGCDAADSIVVKLHKDQGS